MTRSLSGLDSRDEFAARPRQARQAPGATGAAAELAARSYLEHAGLVFVAANVTYRFGELDLVMRDGSTLVFAEVRYRTERGFGDGLTSITATKRRRIALAAQAFLAAHPKLANLPCRFDAIAASGTSPNFTFNWLKHAFTLDDLH